ncbi:VOC family protein [uncultured Pseudomonas sp.]|uniref:VOC family protein n=1 Tax=uncultured Pseudomonas sp. TaxID=114707 RepID=UPI0030D7BE7B|tara:strand:+ start:2187 stop:2555 length:369 start_codon:yes stop_codon:yes gene_type:complete
MRASLSSIMLYAKDMQRTAAFYQQHFGFSGSGDVVEGLIELTANDGGCNLLIHQAAKSLKFGQATVKLMFSVQDVAAFKVLSAAQGLHFGSTHQANGYSFANAKDPDQNNICISSRAFRTPA